MKEFVKIGVVLPLIAACGGRQDESRPNVICILCDDLGYGDLACYGQRYIRTPYLDSMAGEGILFTQAYAGSSVSAPSRAVLMTGQHTGHTEVRGNKEYWKDVPMVRYGNHFEYSRTGQHPYDTSRIILPELMKKSGYTTGLFGKWAGGYEGSSSTPDKRGVDEFFGYICQYQAHLYYPDFLNRYSKASGDTSVVRILLEENIRHEPHGEDYLKRTAYSADLIHQAALEWIDGQNGEQPFFGMFTYTLPHAELVQPRDSILASYVGTFPEDHPWQAWKGSRYNSTEDVHAQFAAMVTRLDAYVGEILDKLREKGLDKNTLVIFTSDNGPHQEGGGDPYFFNSNAGLNGIKRQTYEGGIRVPLIAWWPDRIPSGRVSSLPVVFYDFMPTLCDILDVESPVTDGISFFPELLGKKGQKEHEFLYWEFEETDQIAVRMGDWKLITVSGQPRLYNLVQDPAERNDVSSEHSDIVRKMVDIIRSQHVESPYFRVTLPESF